REEKSIKLFIFIFYFFFSFLFFTLIFYCHIYYHRHHHFIILCLYSIHPLLNLFVKLLVLVKFVDLKYIKPSIVPFLLDDKWCQTTFYDILITNTPFSFLSSM
ncbi:uncharacterized protein BX664DRAFT_71544, partial [Halteromyces radiatus]|uniref:uncharacterized protein n=1 Tax=Halteromyces radiatus TaxID=101107 RepID=UPI00221EFB06